MINYMAIMSYTETQDAKWHSLQQFSVSQHEFWIYLKTLFDNTWKCKFYLLQVFLIATKFTYMNETKHIFTVFSLKGILQNVLHCKKICKKKIWKLEKNKYTVKKTLYIKLFLPIFCKFVPFSVILLF